MAKLSKCRTCSHTVSVKAKHCPSCGEGGPARRKTNKKALGMLLLAGGAFAGGLNGGHMASLLHRHVNALGDQVAGYKAKALSEIEPAAGG